MLSCHVLRCVTSANKNCRYVKTMMNICLQVSNFKVYGYVISLTFNPSRISSHGCSWHLIVRRPPGIVRFITLPSTWFRHNLPPAITQNNLHLRHQLRIFLVSLSLSHNYSNLSFVMVPFPTHNNWQCNISPSQRYKNLQITLFIAFNDATLS